MGILNPSGTLTVQNGLILNSGSTFVWNLGSLKASTTNGKGPATGSPGTDWDQINVSAGALDVQSGAILQIQFIGAIAPQMGDPFWLDAHTWDKIISSLAASIGTSAFTIDNSAWSAFGTFSTVSAADPGIDLVWTPTPSQIPEPSSLVLLGMTAAAAGYGAWRRRKQGQAPAATPA